MKFIWTASLISLTKYLHSLGIIFLRLWAKKKRRVLVPNAQSISFFPRLLLAHESKESFLCTLSSVAAVLPFDLNRADHKNQPGVNTFQIQPLKDLCEFYSLEPFFCQHDKVTVVWNDLRAADILWSKMVEPTPRGIFRWLEFYHFTP